MNLAITILVLALGAPAFAQGDGLYAPAPPPDSAFLRVVNALPDDGALEPTVGNVAFESISFGVVTPYRVVDGGEHVLRAGRIQQQLSVEPNEFYTVAITPDGPRVLTDITLDDRSKGLVSMYNFSSIPELALRTADGSTELLTGLSAGASDSIPVNAVRATLAVFAEDDELATFDVQLERGAGYSAFVFETGGEATVHWVRNETRTE